jgi:hypothetical protein
VTSPFVAPDLDAPRLSHIVSSPIGRLLLTGDGHALTGLWMLDADRYSARASGLTDSPAARARASRAAAELADGWRPWRSYAVQHLWASLEEASPASLEWPEPLESPGSIASTESMVVSEDRS